MRIDLHVTNLRNYGVYTDLASIGHFQTKELDYLN